MSFQKLIHQVVGFDLTLFCEGSAHRTVDTLLVCLSCPLQLAHTALTESVKARQGLWPLHSFLTDRASEPGLQFCFKAGHYLLFAKNVININGITAVI